MKSLTSPCIEWNKCRTPDGYGQFRKKGKNYLAHRVAYCDHLGVTLEQIKGKIVRHICDNPSCVNPEHLLLGTPADNSRDMVIRGRSRKKENHPNAKLTQEQVNEIRERYVRYCRKHGSIALAKDFNVAHITIRDIISGRRW